MKIHFIATLTVSLLFALPALAQQHAASAVKVPVLTTLEEAVNSAAYFQRGVDEHIAKNELDQLHAYAFAARDSAVKANDLATTLTARNAKNWVIM